MAAQQPETRFPGYSARGVPDLQWWLEEVRRGIQWRDQWMMKDRWSTWDAYYRNDWEGVATQVVSKLPVILQRRGLNVFFMIARSMVPRIYFRNPSVSVVAAKPGPDQLGLAKLHERIYNKLIASMGMKRAMQQEVNYTFFRGTGVGKLGFGAQFAPTEPGSLEAADASVKGGGTLEYRAGIDPAMPWYRAVDPGHYVLPAGTVEKEDAPWEVHAVFRRQEEVRLDPRFKNNKTLGPTHGLAHSTGQPQLVETWEVHDRRTGLVFVMAPPGGEQADSALLLDPMEDDLAGANGGPLYTFVFNPCLGTTWGLPDGAVLEPLQEEILEVVRQIAAHRKMTLRKMIVDRSAMTPVEVEALLSEDLGAVFVDSLTGVEVKQIGGVPAELIQEFNRLMEEVRLTVGFSRNQFGEYQPGSEKPSASEARAVQQASDIRVDERRDVVADHLTTIIQDLGQLIHRHWTQERVERVAGPFGVPIWVKYSGEMLRQARMELKVDPDSSLPETKELREAKAKETYALLYPASQQPDAVYGVPIIDSVKLHRFLLHQTHGVAYDDMILGVPNIYGDAMTRMLQQGGGPAGQPVSPGQLGTMFQQAGPAALAATSAQQGGQGQ